MERVSLCHLIAPRGRCSLRENWNLGLPEGNLPEMLIVSWPVIFERGCAPRSVLRTSENQAVGLTFLLLPSRLARTLRLARALEPFLNRAELRQAGGAAPCDFSWGKVAHAADVVERTAQGSAKVSDKTES